MHVFICIVTCAETLHHLKKKLKHDTQIDLYGFDSLARRARVKCISELEDLMEQVSREEVREMLQDEEEEKKRKRREQTHQIVDELEEEDELEKEPESSRSPQIGERLPTRVTRCEAPIV
ncbi:hypothetical protein ADUPG1_000600, partial [Aduncisulcus paluster]